MPRLALTPNLLSLVPAPPDRVDGSSVKETLESAFQLNPRLRGYLFEDDGTLRKHIALIVNGAPIQDRESLSDPLGEDDELFVMQALSGG